MESKQNERLKKKGINVFDTIIIYKNLSIKQINKNELRM